MPQRQGFLIIELVVALVVFGTIVAVVMRLASDIATMHNDIVGKTDMLNVLCSAAEGGEGRASHDQRFGIAEEKIQMFPGPAHPLVARLVELKHICVRSNNKKNAHSVAMTVVSV